MATFFIPARVGDCLVLLWNMARNLKIMENEKHPLDDLKKDEITGRALIWYELSNWPETPQMLRYWCGREGCGGRGTHP